jgi:hypothetical protein
MTASIHWLQSPLNHCLMPGALWFVLKRGKHRQPKTRSGFERQRLPTPGTVHTRAVTSHIATRDTHTHTHPSSRDNNHNHKQEMTDRSLRYCITATKFTQSAVTQKLFHSRGLLVLSLALLKCTPPQIRKWKSINAERKQCYQPLKEHDRHRAKLHNGQRAFPSVNSLQLTTSQTTVTVPYTELGNVMCD